MPQLSASETLVVYPLQAPALALVSQPVDRSELTAVSKMGAPQELQQIARQGRVSESRIYGCFDRLDSSARS